MSPSSLHRPQKRVVLVSDGTGETAAMLAKAAMVQFEDDHEVYFTRYKNIRNESQPICTVSFGITALRYFASNVSLPSS